MKEKNLHKTLQELKEVLVDVPADIEQEVRYRLRQDAAGDADDELSGYEEELMLTGFRYGWKARTVTFFNQLTQSGGQDLGIFEVPKKAEDTEDYNGWPNRETWRVALVLDWYGWDDRALKMVPSHPQSPDSLEGCRDRMVADLAKEMEHAIKEEHSFLIGDPLMDGLLKDALHRVDWRRLAARSVDNILGALNETEGL